MDKNLHLDIFKTSTCLGREELDAYLHGRLSGAALRRVENHLIDCPLCSDAVDGLEESAAFGVAQLEDFSSFKKKLHQPSGGVIRKLNPYTLLKRSVSVAALLALGMFAYFSLFKSSGSQLYEQFYTSYQNDIPLNSRSTDSAQLISPSFERALNSYSTGNFSASIPAFEETLKEEPDNAAACFFAGMACLEANQPEKAVSHLQKVKDQSNGYSQKAEWYLILAHLKSGDKAGAKSLLETYLSRSGDIFKADEAARLLKKL